MIPAKRLSAAVLAALLFATSIAMCGCDAGGGDKRVRTGKFPVMVNGIQSTRQL